MSTVITKNNDNKRKYVDLNDQKDNDTLRSPLRLIIYSSYSNRYSCSEESQKYFKTKNPFNAGANSAFQQEL